MFQLQVSFPVIHRVLQNTFPIRAPKKGEHITKTSIFFSFLFFLRRSFALVAQAGVPWRDWLTATSASWVQAILLPQPPQ